MMIIRRIPRFRFREFRVCFSTVLNHFQAHWYLHPFFLQNDSKRDGDRESLNSTRLNSKKSKQEENRKESRVAASLRPLSISNSINALLE